MIVEVPEIQVPENANPVQGSPGAMVMVDVGLLCVDFSYQRNMTSSSARLAEKIAATFDWRRFVPAVGVRMDDGRIALVDGQHRTAAAKARGIQKVPVYVLECTMPEAAGAFAAINGSVTPISATDIYRAQLAAGDPDAKELQSVLDIAGVKVVSFKGGCSKGETRSVNVLRRALCVYGRDLLILVLQCITETGDGNPGCITGAVVNGLAVALLKKTDLLSTPSVIFEALDDVRLSEVVHSSEVEAARTKNPQQGIIAREINRVLVGIGREVRG